MALSLGAGLVLEELELVDDESESTSTVCVSGSSKHGADALKGRH